MAESVIQPPIFYKFCPMCGAKLEDKKIADVAERRICPICKWVYYPHPHTAAAAIVWNLDKREVLLVQRAHQPKQGLWSLPAGFAEYLEHPETTLRRELKEETGLEVLSIRFLEFKQAFDDPRAPGTLVFFYEVETHGEPRNDEVENQAIGWWPLDNLPPLAWKTHQEILDSF